MMIGRERHGRAVPYPDAAWNSWTPGEDGHDRFVGVNAIRIGPDGALWVVDRGGPGIGQPVVPGGAKLVRIDIGSDRVAYVYGIASVLARVDRGLSKRPLRRRRTFPSTA
jgi:hypothetical protein